MKFNFLPFALAALLSGASALEDDEPSRRMVEEEPATMEDKPMEDMHSMMDSNITSVVDVIMNKEMDYGSLLAALEAAGLDGALATAGPFTLFAPNEEAFVKLGNETLMKLLDPEWRAHLADILSYHVIMGKIVQSGDLVGGTAVEMGNGEYANITTGQPRPSINGHGLGSPDMMADNGVVHGIENVLLPSWLGVDVVQAAAGLPDIFGTLTEMIVLANLTELLSGPGPYTVFAPTNEAFEKLEKLDNETWAWYTSPDGAADLVDLLSYHVYPGIVTMEQIGGIVEMGESFTMVNNYFADLTAEMNDNATDVYAMYNTTDGEDVDVVTSAFEEMKTTYMINGHKIVSGDILVSNGIIHVIDGVNMPMFVRK